MMRITAGAEQVRRWYLDLDRAQAFMYK